MQTIVKGVRRVERNERTASRRRGRAWGGALKDTETTQKYSSPGALALCFCSFGCVRSVALRNLLFLLISYSAFYDKPNDDELLTNGME